jgi:acetoin utilization protein AcuB
MNFTAPVSSLMTTKLVTVAPGDPVSMIKSIFDQKRIHHILVVRHKTLLGIISRSDYLQWIRSTNLAAVDAGNHPASKPAYFDYKVEDIMITGIATLESTDRLNVALQLFSENRFHAIPVVDEGEVVGILTTHDIIKSLLEEDTTRIMSN